jgi:xanthine dehydrogenase accessory factor
VPGSSAIIGHAGLLAGTVGGGPAEYQVVLKSQQALESKIPEVLFFDLTGILVENSDSVCGGQMVVLLDSSPEKHQPVWITMNDSLTRNIPGVLLTIVEEMNNKSLDISRLWLTSDNPALIETIPALTGNTIQQMLEILTPGDFRLIPFHHDHPELNNFACAETIVPPPSLVIAGAGHVGKALAHLGKFLGFEVTVWDDRSEYASKINIPDADILLNGSVNEGPGILEVKKDSYLVIVTRGHKNDAEVLRKWIRTDAAYIGMMGSRTKVAQMQQQFLEQGWATQEEWDRVFTPIGLKIGAKTVEEIAVCIAAQLIQVQNIKKTKY